jgi:hypothetical protein
MEEVVVAVSSGQSPPAQGRRWRFIFDSEHCWRNALERGDESGFQPLFVMGLFFPGRWPGLV